MPILPSTNSPHETAFSRCNQKWFGLTRHPSAPYTDALSCNHSTTRSTSFALLLFYQSFVSLNQQFAYLSHQKLLMWLSHVFLYFCVQMRPRALLDNNFRFLFLSFAFIYYLVTYFRFILCTFFLHISSLHYFHAVISLIPCSVFTVYPVKTSMHARHYILRPFSHHLSTVICSFSPFFIPFLLNINWQ